MRATKCCALRLCSVATAMLAPLAALSQPVSGGCPPRDALPAAPQYATDLNGVAWPDYCFELRELEEHFFIIGDWGGIFMGPDKPPKTASKGNRQLVHGVDEQAQLLVAEQMKKRANISKPRYVLNVGDNFYWGGINARCSKSTMSVDPSSLQAQWPHVFENVYDGPDLAGKPWLGVLGNHDYGGFMFTQGWDQAIAYTWGPGDRWVTPAQYWSTTVHYSDFSVDYIFVDSNINDAMQPLAHPGHNMCSQKNNIVNATCGVTGPASTADCPSWFQRLWEEQIPWMESRLNASKADWRVIVTHFPPNYHRDVWAKLSEEYKIDLIVTGHRHQQELYDRDPNMGNAAWVVSGGGGGICSEGIPMEDGNDDMYGFMDVTISKNSMKIEAISHSGILRKTVVLETSTPSTTTTVTFTTTTLTSTRSARHHDVEYISDAPPGRLANGGLVSFLLALVALMVQ